MATTVAGPEESAVPRRAEPPAGTCPFECDLRRVVNFGIAAVARASGAAGGEELGFRCECGERSCGTRLRIRLADYDPASETQLLDPRHAAAADAVRIAGRATPTIT